MQGMRSTDRARERPTKRVAGLAARRALLALALLAAAALLAGCLSTGATRPPERAEAASSAEPADGRRGERLDGLLAAARELETTAKDRAGVEAALAAWDRALELDPESFEALDASSDLVLLLGAAYAQDRGEQRRLYLEAMRRAERAMRTFPAFRARLDAGELPWVAAEALGAEGMHPMHVWSTAIFYLYRDTMGSARRLLNVPWLRRAQAVLAHMRTVDPDWSDGLLRFSWGMVYFALPPVAGGDRELAAAEFERAIELGPDWLVARWGRGRYFHLERGDRQGFEADLGWVVSQDPATAGGPTPWNVYFQREAEDLLARADELFPGG